MFAHLVFFFYIFGLISGVIALTVIYFSYHKTKYKILKKLFYIILIVTIDLLSWVCYQYFRTNLKNQYFPVILAIDFISSVSIVIILILYIDFINCMYSLPFHNIVKKIYYSFMIVLFILIIYGYINLLSINNIIEMNNYLLQPCIRAMVIFELIIITSVILYGNVIIVKYYKHNLYPVLKPFTLLTLSLSVIIIFSVIIDETFNPDNNFAVSLIPPAGDFLIPTYVSCFQERGLRWNPAKL